MSTARPVMVAFGPGPIAAATAHALAAAIPGAMQLRLGNAPRRPAATVDVDALWQWLGDRAGRPTIRCATAATDHASRRLAPPQDSLMFVVGLQVWDTAMPALLTRRPDLRPVALIDMPTVSDWPEFHQPREVAALHRALETLKALAPLVIVPSPWAAAQFRVLGLRADRMIVEPAPSGLAGTGPIPEPALTAAPYMVVVGPIEARANTLLLLHLWRDALVRGRAVPKLVLAGARGAQIEELAPLLDWNPALRAVVAEAPGLSPFALRRLLDHARALLVPDVAAAPIALVRDAQAIGTPVIAAIMPDAPDLDVGPRLDPFDGPGWRTRIADASARARDPRAAVPTLPDWNGYAARIVACSEAMDLPGVRSPSRGL